MPDSPGLGEQALNKAAEIGLSSQLDKVEKTEKVALNVSILLKETSQTQQVAFTATPRVSANGQSVSLENVEYSDSEELSPELTKALVDQTSKILNLSNFDLEGITLRVKQLKVEAGKLTLQAEADVEQIPSG